MPGTGIHTPWGYPQHVEELAEGVWRVSTASHGGLKLSRERWEELPAGVRDTLITPTFAEEDCEEPIVRTLLGLGDARDREFAFKVAGCFRRYAPALPYLRDPDLEPAPYLIRGQHYHIVRRGGHGTNPFGRFDAREEAEAFANDGDNVSGHGGMEAIGCRNNLPFCRRKGGMP